ncbi:hypothetical protein L3Q67_38475 [Saccharothrix sp. AJ9571]|nr:hypothetical protein L3Q67_38475 [Saccharothrix sp. AJ9571]
MTYFPDLSTYEYWPSSHPMVNIGWLEPGHDFPTGDGDLELLEALVKLESVQQNLTRGFHVCGFCDSPVEQVPSPYTQTGETLMGFGEIHAVGADGVRYAAPTLVLHYVVEHGYRPPAPFLDAVLRTADELTARMTSNHDST